jgi:F-type H+-transporting ATPase subunit epsilon
MQCTVVTPERTVLDEEADFVAVTLYDGELGIAPSRTPLVGRLGLGEMRITTPERMKRYYVEGGFVEVVGDVITVLTQRAVPAEELNEVVLREQLEVARIRGAATPEQEAARDRHVLQTRAQLNVARKTAG